MVNMLFRASFSAALRLQTRVAPAVARSEAAAVVPLSLLPSCPMRRGFSGATRRRTIQGAHWELKLKDPEPPRPVQTLEGLARPDKWKTSRYHCNWLRENGRVPCTILKKGDTSQKMDFSLSLLDLQREIRKVRYSFTNLVYRIKLDNQDEAIPVICCELQTDTFTQDPISVQFMTFEKGQKYNVRIPVTFEGAEDSPGLKRGGILVRPSRSFPAIWDADGGELIPEKVVIDLSAAGPKSLIKVSALKERGEWPSEHLVAKYPEKGGPKDYVLITYKGKVREAVDE